MTLKILNKPERSKATKWKFESLETKIYDVPGWVDDHVIYSGIPFATETTRIWFVNYGKLELMQIGDTLEIDSRGHVKRNG